MTFDADMRRSFLAEGLVRLPGVIPRQHAAAMADRLWAHMTARDGIVPEKPQTWTKERPGQFGDLKRAGAFDAVASPAMVAVLDAFFGEPGWLRPSHWGQPLVAFPRSGRWVGGR